MTYIVDVLLILLCISISIFMGIVLFGTGWCYLILMIRRDIKDECKSYYLESQLLYLKELQHRGEKLDELDKLIDCRRKILKDLRDMIGRKLKK